MKKMRKANVITALALTVVMLAAMTGIVLGWGGSIGPTDSAGFTKTLFEAGDMVYATGSGIVDHDGDGLVDVYVTDDVAWSDGEVIATNPVHIHLTAVTPAQIAATIYLGTVSNAGGASDIPYPTAGTYAYDIVVDMDRDGIYEPLYDSVVPTTPVEDIVDDVPFGCKAFETKIPEFSTIAIPVASILGLLFFFNYRKRKKE